MGEPPEAGAEGENKNLILDWVPEKEKVKMKKLMCAVAALAAGVAMADTGIQSANVVGYQQLDTESSGSTMVAPTMLKVSESNSVTLAELKVTGYTDAKWDTSGKKAKNTGGCTAGYFVVATLTTAGTEKDTYSWLDYYTSATTKVGPGWFKDGNATPIEGGAESVVFNAGDALWTKGSGYKLQPAGAVNPFDIVFKTESSGSTAVGNCTPVDLNLGQLTVTGYTEAKWDTSGKKAKNTGGCTAGYFVVATLTTAGTEKDTYSWLDYYTSATTKVGPGWFKDGNATPIEGGAESVAIESGKALWVKGSGYNLVIPAPEL